MYDKHMDQHKTILMQVEEEKSLNAIIPCEICKTEIPFNQYEGHLKGHNTVPLASTCPVPEDKSKLIYHFLELQEDKEFNIQFLLSAQKKQPNLSNNSNESSTNST